MKLSNEERENKRAQKKERAKDSTKENRNQEIG